MHRCAVAALVAAVAIPVSVAAQDVVQRPFPQTALRGQIAFGIAPEIVLNGQPARLAPGARLHGTNNLLMAPGALVGAKAVVNYTFEINGLVQEVWILRPDEQARKPWPTTMAEAQGWRFDPAAQVWIKP
jgi:hypothetical protein